MENNENNVQSQVNEVQNENETNQSQNNNGNKKITISLFAIVLILVLGIGIGAGFLFAGKMNNTTGNNTTTNNSVEIKSSKKIDESKDWVYDADYFKENKKIYQDSAKTEEDAVNSDKDLVVPFININSEAAKTANENIKALYEDYYSKYGTVSKSYSDMEYTVYEHYELKYEKYINDNILSVVITLHEGAVIVDGGAGGGTFTKYTYNFNLDTLNEATLNDMAIKCGFSSEYDVTSKIKEWEEKQRNILIKADQLDIFKGVQNGKYFIDGNGKLNFLFRFSTSSTGDSPEIIEPNKDIELFYTEEQAEEQIKINNEAKQNQSIVNNNEKSNSENIKKFINANLINIENASIKSVKVNSNVSISIDLDKDGIEDKIICNPEQNMLSIKLNNHDSQEMIARDVSTIYVADIDENDKYLDIIIKWDYASSDYVYSIYTYSEQFNEYIHIQYNDGSNIYLEGTKMYIDHKGVVLTQDKCYSAAKEPISYEYYNLRLFGMIEIPVSTYANRLIEFEDILFTDDLNKIKPTSYNGEYEDAISKGYYTHYENVKAYIIGYETSEGKIDRTKIKVRLQDGREGWLFSVDGNLAG